MNPRVYNFSQDNDYHTQRNNALIPHASCNTTSMVMALKQAGRDLPAPDGVQPEDHLTGFLRGEKGMEALRRLAPWAIDKATGEALYPPNEVHAVLTWGVNELLGEEVSTFRVDWDLDELIQELTAGAGVVLSGSFPLQGGGELSHVVSLAGYRIAYPQGNEPDSFPPKFEQLTQLFIDDPYGNYLTSYTDHHGNNTPMSPIDFMQIMKRSGDRKKWAHVIRPAV